MLNWNYESELFFFFFFSLPHCLICEIPKHWTNWMQSLFLLNCLILLFFISHPSRYWKKIIMSGRRAMGKRRIEWGLEVYRFFRRDWVARRSRNSNGSNGRTHQCGSTNCRVGSIFNKTGVKARERERERERKCEKASAGYTWKRRRRTGKSFVERGNGHTHRHTFRFVAVRIARQQKFSRFELSVDLSILSRLAHGHRILEDE